MNILFIVPYVPSLVRVRPYQILRHLSLQGHKIILATIWTNEKEREELNQIRNYCDEVISIQVSSSRSLLNCLLALPTQFPLQYVYSWHSSLFNLIIQRLRQINSKLPVDIIHVEHLRGAQFGVRIIQDKERSTAYPYPPIVWDSVDCISYLFKQASEKSRQSFRRQITKFELKRTERLEGWLTTVFDHVLVTSQKDKTALSALALNAAHSSKIDVLSNGVDLEYFRSDDSITREKATLVITGKMSYHANVSMVLYFVNRIMPLVWKTNPDIKLWVVGKDPPSDITQLKKNPKITVTGMVESIQPYLQQATIAVAPIQYGAGIQNKVLEAMSFSTPVIASSLATTALSVKSGEEVVIANSPDEWARAILSLINSPEQQKQIGTKGRLYVEKNHNWSDIVQQLVDIYEELTDHRKPQIQ
jgi:sugar transferase (PEP-CTERM/EpsH1 system associated)